MFKCLFIRRKLHDYLDNSLSEIDKIKVKGHIDVCDNCRERFTQIKSIIELAAEKKIPKPTDEFWHNFKIDLDRKLNERLVTPVIFERKISYRLEPIFAYAIILVFILTMTVYLYKEPPLTSLRLAQDEELIDEIEMLDELGELSELDYNEDAYLEEISFFNQKQYRGLLKTRLFEK